MLLFYVLPMIGIGCRKVHTRRLGRPPYGNSAFGSTEPTTVAYADDFCIARCVTHFFRLST